MLLVCTTRCRLLQARSRPHYEGVADGMPSVVVDDSVAVVVAHGEHHDVRAWTRADASWVEAPRCERFYIEGATRARPDARGSVGKRVAYRTSR